MSAPRPPRSPIPDESEYFDSEDSDEDMTPTSNFEAAGRWINQGLKFLDQRPLPNDLHQLCIGVTTVPANILTRLLPSDNISVTDLIKFRLPKIGQWPFSEKIMFQEDPPRGKLFIRSEIPPEPYIEELRKKFGQAMLDGKISMRDPRTPDARLPLWVIEFWWALHCAYNSRREWSEGMDWIREKQEGGHHHRVFRDVKQQLAILPWNKSLNGPAAAIGRTTKQLLQFLFDDEWLSGSLVDMMAAYLVSQLSMK
ncbi:uncharacterized protein HD556DRAFT_1437643 [Suillus plorans]|uniref:Uncharacterized protein n=1 Tax=Suillus plorans TaxID=116603 RepID=A0A9P7DVF8_9AGAM|nr:uncharacterized protein HD556DRAFT_1437643 [Suillus plorans]KAG1803908.1 hypothetical protein HD556DRAFT_1437643 [Suillus plorans]